jgi:hypothetical protein
VASHVMQVAAHYYDSKGEIKRDPSEPFHMHGSCGGGGGTSTLQVLMDPVRNFPLIWRQICTKLGVLFSNFKVLGIYTMWNSEQ